MITERDGGTIDGQARGGRRAEAGADAARASRRQVPRRRLPAGRAVVGGLLVSASAVGAIVLSGVDSGPPTVPVVVAREAVEPGTALDETALRVAEMALPDELVAATYADPADLTGTVARSHLAPGELLQHGDVVESTAAQRAAAPAREIAVRLDADRAVDGRLEPGDTVDVLATYGTGVDAFTVVVLRDADVLGVGGEDDPIGGSGAVVITLALDSRHDTVALAHAVDVAALNVVRTTTAGDDDPATEAGPYRPAPASVEEVER